MRDIDKLNQNPVEEMKKILDLLKEVKDYQKLAEYIVINGKGRLQKLDSSLKSFCDRTKNIVKGDIDVSSIISNEADDIIKNNFLDSVRDISEKLEKYKDEIKKIDFNDEVGAGYLCKSILSEMEIAYGITVSVIKNFVNKVR